MTKCKKLCQPAELLLYLFKGGITLEVVNGIDMELIFQREKPLDFFINVTCRAAVKRNEALPHTLIICDYPRLAKAIGSYIALQIQPGLFSKYELSNITPGDLAAKLTSLPNNAVLFLENGTVLNRMQSSAIDVLKNAIQDGCIEVKIGKGPSARTCLLDLPPFSFIVVVDTPDQIAHGLKRVFDNVVHISSISKQELCTIEAIASASENDLLFEADAVTEIVNASNEDFRTSARLVRWVRDYMLVQNDHYIRIPKDYVMKVIALM